MSSKNTEDLNIVDEDNGCIIETVDFILTKESYYKLMDLSQYSKMHPNIMIALCIKSHIFCDENFIATHNIRYLRQLIKMQNEYFASLLPIPPGPIENIYGLVLYKALTEKNLIKLMEKISKENKLSRHEMLSYWIESNTIRNRQIRKNNPGILGTIAKTLVIIGEACAEYSKTKNKDNNKDNEKALIESENNEQVLPLSVYVPSEITTIKDRKPIESCSGRKARERKESGKPPRYGRHSKKHKNE